MNYVYGGQFYGDADITARMDTWYGAGVEVVFACGGGIYTSAAEAAVKKNGKVIGVDVDQQATIDGTYGKGVTVTSAMKGLAATVNTVLTGIQNGKWDSDFGGKLATLGLVGTDPTKNYVQLAPTTVYNSTFTEANYKSLVADMYNGKIKVDNSSDVTRQLASAQLSRLQTKATSRVNYHNKIGFRCFHLKPFFCIIWYTDKSVI